MTSNWALPLRPALIIVDIFRDYLNSVSLSVSLSLALCRIYSARRKRKHITIFHSNFEIFGTARCLIFSQLFSVPRIVLFLYSQFARIALTDRAALRRVWVTTDSIQTNSFNMLKTKTKKRKQKQKQKHKSIFENENRVASSLSFEIVKRGASPSPPFPYILFVIYFGKYSKGKKILIRYCVHFPIVSVALVPVVVVVVVIIVVSLIIRRRLRAMWINLLMCC